MISPSASYWKAFFDPADPSHRKARSDIAVYDREKLLLSPFVIAEVVSWLLSRGKKEHAAWFLDYAQNTVNVRIYHFGKEEFARVALMSAAEGLTLERASLEYLRRALNCDITGY